MHELFERFLTDAEFMQLVLATGLLLTAIGNVVVWQQMTKCQMWRKSYIDYLRQTASNPLTALALFTPLATLLAIYLFLHGVVTGGAGDMPSARR